jgi:hypothetical protein
MKLDFACRMLLISRSACMSMNPGDTPDPSREVARQKLFIIILMHYLLFHYVNICTEVAEAMVDNAAGLLA